MSFLSTLEKAELITPMMSTLFFDDVEDDNEDEAVAKDLEEMVAMTTIVVKESAELPTTSSVTLSRGGKSTEIPSLVEAARKKDGTTKNVLVYEKGKAAMTSRKLRKLYKIICPWEKALLIRNWESSPFGSKTNDCKTRG